MQTALGIVTLGIWCGLASFCFASSTTVFQDGFEFGSLGTWIVSTSNDGRVAVRSDFSPFEGEFALVLDGILAPTAATRQHLGPWWQGHRSLHNF